MFQHLGLDIFYDVPLVHQEYLLLQVGGLDFGMLKGNDILVVFFHLRLVEGVARSTIH